MKEIGSEFWLEENSNKLADDKIPAWFYFGSDREFLLSGRTAIDFVLRDLLKNKLINTVYFPSYGCQSMIQPFKDHGIEMILYDVDVDEEDQLRMNINLSQKCDVFFAMNYFGFSKGRMDNYIDRFKKKDVIVIEDATQSLLSDQVFNPHSDYIIISLRKWFPILSGGLAVKTRGQFNVKPKDITLEAMTSIRKEAMIQKGKFLSGDHSIVKESYLEQYNVANKLLNKDYGLYRIDSESYEILLKLNVEFIKSIRQKNAKFIYTHLKMSTKYKLLFKDLDQGDCPIFVPIIFNNREDRNNIRSFLVSNKIYCPIHWPKPALVSERSVAKIYNKELSLVADQRYDEADMQYLVRRLAEFYG